MIVRAADADGARQALTAAGETVTVIGEVVAGERGVEIAG